MPKKTEKAGTPGKGEIFLYWAPDGMAALDVHLEAETLWLNPKIDYYKSNHSRFGTYCQADPKGRIP